MNRSDRMRTIKELADGRAQEAGRAVAQAQRALEEREAQLAQLRGYRDEYVRGGARDGAADPVRLQNYHAFLARLGEAIRQQEEAVAVARRELDARTADWHARRVESASLGKVVDRLATGERRTADRRDQRETDERALRRALGLPD